MRTLCVGDIHGGLKALKQVLERSNYNFKEDKLIFLGDYVDGWNEVAQTIQFLIELEEKAIIKPIFIRGNHDVWCEKFLLYREAPHLWLQQGGLASENSYVESGYLEDIKHIEFFKHLHNYYIDEENRGFVHGGFTSKRGLGHEPYESNYYWDRNLWQLALSVSKEYNDINPNDFRYVHYPFENHKEIYIGHTTTGMWLIKPHYLEYKIEQQPKQGRIVVPMHRCNMWNLDTGGGYEGKLTIMDIDTKEFWQSDYVNTLYPNERGR